MNNSVAPIALFVYQRLDHLVRTVESLKRNELAAESELFIFSDAARNESDFLKVAKVRNYLKTIDGFKRVEVIEAEKNQGLANSIISGVTRLSNAYGRVVVLEDDIVTSKYFLKFMNDGLNRYQNDEKVMHLSGFGLPIQYSGDKETYFIRPTSCWGWATWKRAWKNFEKNPDEIIQKFTPTMIKDFNLDNKHPYFDQVIANAEGKLNTWAIFWYSSVYLNNGLSLHPVNSYTLNIGLDGSGEHCDPDDTYDVKVAGKPIEQFEPIIEESLPMRKLIGQFYKNSKKSIIARSLSKIKKLLK